MKKVLFVAHVDSHIRHFHIPYLKYFKEQGYEVHVATSNDENEKFPYCDVKHEVSIERSPFKINNLKAIKELKKIIDENDFEIIHCHTPMGGVVARLAAKNARKKGTKVIYTAHGFHFFKGAPKKNWMIYYPVEKWLSRYTDALITINKEDYELAKNKFHAKNTYLTHGVGVDSDKYTEEKLTDEELTRYRQEIGINENDFVMLYVAELNENKNQSMLIEAMKELQYDNIKLLLVGKGTLEEQYKEKVKEYCLENKIKFLGYRRDVDKILKLADICVATSKREGLPLNLVEAELSGVPVIATKNRGHNEIVIDCQNGYSINSQEELVEKIKLLYENKDEYKKLKTNARNSAMKFSLNNALEETKEIYEKTINYKKKILHLLSTDKYSGAENVVCQIINSFEDEYDMIYCSPNGDIKKVLDERKINYLSIKKFNYFEIRKAIKKYNPDIVHAHDYKSSVMAAICSGKRKVVSHLHNNVPFAKSWNVKSLLYYLLTQKYASILTVSDAVIEEGIFFNDLNKEKTVVVNNCLNKDKILERANECGTEDFDILFVGRLTDQKNPIRFIKIVEKITKKNTSIKSIMLGDGELKNECENYIKENKLENNITLKGFVDNPFPYFKKAKLLILPSKFEGFGLVAIESMILGTPVLNSGVGGLQSIFKGNEVYICNTDEEYVSKTIEILDNNNGYDFSTITEKYTDEKEWKEKIRVGYEDMEVTV